MTILTDLHTTEGITLVMITHEARIAHYCQSIVHIQDGQIQSEEKI